MKTFFLSRHVREKLLVLGLALIGIALWLPSVIGRTRQLSTERAATEDQAQKQQDTLDSRAQVEREEAAAISKLKPELSFDKLHMQAELNTIVKAANIDTTNNSSMLTPVNTKSATSKVLSLSQAKLQLNNIDMPTLVNFYRELSQRSPYISITGCTITVRPVPSGRGAATTPTAASAADNTVFNASGYAQTNYNAGNGVTDTGGQGGGAAASRRGPAATTLTAATNATRRGPTAVPVLPGNMNVVFKLTAVQIIHPGALPPGAKAVAPAKTVSPTAATS